jgi:hypothetical protein
MAAVREASMGIKEKGGFSTRKDIKIEAISKMRSTAIRMELRNTNFWRISFSSKKINFFKLSR